MVYLLGTFWKQRSHPVIFGISASLLENLHQSGVRVRASKYIIFKPPI